MSVSVVFLFFGMNKFVVVKRLIVVVVGMIIMSDVAAQRVAVKTNALYWATLSPNVGLEFRLSRHLTLNVETAANPFDLSDKLKTRFFGVTPELRYWFEARPQAHHFVGAMALGSTYSLTLKDKFHEGDAYGLGLTYGYSFVLSTRWSLEATVGAGLLKVNEKKYRRGEAVPAEANRDKFMLAPMKLGVSFVYLIK